MEHQFAAAADTAPIAWQRIPLVLKLAALPALLAFFAHLSLSAHREVNGVQTSCTYFDILGPIVAVVLVVMAVLGVQADRRQHPAYRLGGAVYGIAAVYLLIAAVHVVRGIGLVGGPCG